MLYQTDNPDIQAIAGHYVWLSWESAITVTVDTRSGKTLKMASMDFYRYYRIVTAEDILDLMWAIDQRVRESETSQGPKIQASQSTDRMILTEMLKANVCRPQISREQKMSNNRPDFRPGATR